MNLFNFLAKSAAKYPEKIAVICNAEKISYRALAMRSDYLAAALNRLGITKGMKVAILSLNSLAYVEIIFGLMKIGAVGVPLNYRLPKREIKSLLEHAEAKAIFFESALKELVPQDAENLEHIICIGNAHKHAGVFYDELFLSPQKSFAPAKVNEGDESFLIYTAGTTGSPKGVMLTHASQITNTLNYSAAYAMNPQDIELAPTPLFHCSTLGRVFTYVFNGATFILGRKFDPAECLDCIQDRKVTSTTQTPTLYHRMFKIFLEGNWNTESVKRVVSGASPMPLKTKKALKVLFPAAGFFNLYGLTEASPGVSVLTPPDFYRKMQSIGRPLKNVAVRIIDGNNRPVPTGHVGEIICRGPNIMKGYYKDSAATREALQDGWLHTGDLGKLDDEGFLYLVGRKKDLVISGGVNIYPAEVEEVLSQHPAIEDAAVIGVPDEIWGEKVLAVVVAQAKRCTEQDIIHFCRERLAGFRCPKAVVFTERIPRNAAQKVLKEELRRRYRGSLKRSLP